MTAPTGARPGRNEPCHCGSGRKYKHCCLERDDVERAVALAAAQAAAVTPEPAATPAAPPRAPRHQTDQPWKAKTSRGFIPKSRTPRKVGGS